MYREHASILGPRGNRAQHLGLGEDRGGTQASVPTGRPVPESHTTAESHITAELVIQTFLEASPDHSTKKKESSQEPWHSAL